MISTLLHLFLSGDILTCILNLLFLLYFIFLIKYYSKHKYDDKERKLWYKLCLLPIIVSVIHCIIFASGSAIFEIVEAYKNIYAASILILVAPLFGKGKTIYKIYRFITLVLLSLLLIGTIGSDKVVNYTRKSLTDSYNALCNYLEKNYIMSEWKKIDYEALKKQGLLLVEETEESGDIELYYDALDNLVNTFNDGHMSLSFTSDNDYLLNKFKKFNDYGLSLITLDDDTTIAIDTEEGLEIKDGDVITKWNGVPIEEAIKYVNPPVNESIIDNEKILKTFFLSGLGSETVTVSYIKEDEEEVTTTLSKLDNELPRAVRSYSEFTRSHEDKDIEYKMLTNDIGYLKIGKEETNELADSISYLTGNNIKARNMFKSYLNKLRKEGMKKLIIDIRNNKGGYDEVATALASLFTKEKMYAYSVGATFNGKSISLGNHYVYGNGEFSDIGVVVLTNMRCGSAGDGLALYLSRIDGIRVVGLSNPSGINQETGGIIYMPYDAVIYYPTGLILDNNGNPNIDVDETRKSRNPLDIKIPLNKESALKIFNGTDYELEWVIDYLNK